MGGRLPNVEVRFGFHFHLISAKLVIYKISFACLMFLLILPSLLIFLSMNCKVIETVRDIEHKNLPKKANITTKFT